MANRYLAFGYKIADGKLCVEETEAELVKAAFLLYAAGKSYSQIAERFTLSGIRYNIDSDKWNKNMVKRIIENDKYIGGNGYPQIIEEKLYNKANKTRLSKVINKPPEKAELFSAVPSLCRHRFRAKRERKTAQQGGALAAEKQRSGHPAGAGRGAQSHQNRLRNQGYGEHGGGHQRRLPPAAVPVLRRKERSICV